ncbi:hypothetical protein OYC64_000852 [Pagothenia borchgrevinki]|uniref:C-type lectin domain-containing protein n=1 Tax=Pagothenia borchgrevinki TaxID=8213 RepID=A0ABD2HDZ3_PAGBO
MRAAPLLGLSMALAVSSGRMFKTYWFDAERRCIAMGGNLASIRSTREYNQIRKLVRKASGRNLNVWVGGHDAVHEGVWLWSDGSKFTFGGWARGEPNNHGGKEHCMEMNFRGQNYVNDIKCLDAQTFVCSSSLE